MAASRSFAELDGIIAEGRFGKAFDYLSRELRHLRTTDPHLYDTYEAELSLEIGRNEAAAARAEKCLNRGPSPAISSRLHRVLAMIAFAEGDRPKAEEHLNAASRLCDARGHSRAVLELSRFNLALRFERLETAMARLPDVRRSVTNAGDARLMVLLRIHVARAEFHRRGLTEAQRHHDAARRLLERFPSVWLRGIVDLDSSVGWMMMGDVEAALSAAESALRQSDESGHFHTRLAAEVNISHILERRGNFTAARRHIDRVMRSVGSNRQVSRAVLDSWANLLISSGDFEQAREILHQDGEFKEGGADACTHWDAIGLTYTRARLCQAEHRWLEGAGALTTALRFAETFGDAGWTRRIVNNRCRMRALGGDVAGAIDDLRRSSVAEADALDPLVMAEQSSALAAVRVMSGDAKGAVHYLSRGRRIAFAMQNVSLRDDVSRGLEAVAENADHKCSAGTLESAVALLELAGYPHILGPEVLALLRATACAEGAALVAAGPGPAKARILEVTGWTEPEARAALTDDSVERLPLGTRGDETWTLFVRPPADLERFCTFAAIRRLLSFAGSLDRHRRQEQQRTALWPADALEADPDCIWAAEQMVETLAVARRIAPSPLSVLITGETGTGKEMLARAIHRASDRAERPFLPFNCTAVPRDMLESQLFGFRKGAFTGADTAFPGVIRAAAGGTLFLDEIAEVGPDVQPKLLRFLESHEIHPLGEPHPITVDVRIIAATNAGIEHLVAEGRFREDLFYRLNVVRLRLPPLRERREEIPPLVQHYLRRYGDELRKGRLTVSDETLEYLLLFSWPGNVRQLANEVRRMVALAEPDAAITPALLSPEILASRRTIPATPERDPGARVALDQPLPAAVEQLEQLMVRRALDQTHGRVDDAARLLGISRKGLFLKRRRWGLGASS